MRHLTLSTALFALLAAPAFAQDSETNNALNGLDIITVVGTQTDAAPTSAVTFISPEDLARQDYSDINRVLRVAPGVNIQEEDGYGLRPNIGIRGSGADRSSKVVIMEDGVLMAPAAYAAPAAYYFPTTGRMNAVELTKGAATVKYGPNTTAGALQFFSTPIPDDASAHVELAVSDLGRTQAHAWAGDRFAAGAFDLGFLVETYQDHADGFKDIDAGGETGFDIEDYVVKLGAFSRDGRHSLQFKYQYKDEVSDETYLGLSQADFNANPNRRYNASANDQFVAEHETFQLTHNLSLNDNFQLTTIAYRTDFARNWSKLDRFDNSGLSGLASCDSLDEILRDTTTCSAEFQVLEGAPGFTSADDVLQIRANNREYYTKGVQTALGGTVNTGDVTHNLVASIRYHTDGVDRFQDQDGYRIENTALVLTTDNAPGTQANRLSEARALSAYLEDRIEMDRLSITAGLRVESVETEQRRWNTPDRTLTPDSERENSYTEWLPALSASFAVTDDVSILGGIHKGFSAPSVSSRETSDPERSTVYEGGLRYQGLNGLAIEAVGFVNDYSNLVGVCTNSSGASECDAGDQFNGGEAEVAGLELTAQYDAAPSGSDFTLPLGLTYTYTDAEFRSDSSSTFFGTVLSGDSVPYVPTHQLTLSAALETHRYGVSGVLNTVSKSRNVAGSGNIPDTEAIGGRTVVDASAYYQLRDGVRLNVRAENVLNGTYVAARRPYGLRPGKPREIFAGVTLDF